MDKTECFDEIPCFDLESCSYFSFHGRVFRPGETLHVWLKQIADPKPGMAALVLVLDHVARQGERAKLGEWDVNAHADAMEEPLDMRQAVLNVLMRHQVEDPYDRTGAWFDPARFRLRRMRGFDVDDEYLRFSLQLSADTNYRLAEIHADSGEPLEAQECFRTARWLESLKPPESFMSTIPPCLPGMPSVEPKTGEATGNRDVRTKIKSLPERAAERASEIVLARLGGERWQWSDITLLRVDDERRQTVVVQHNGETMRTLRKGAPKALTPLLWGLLLRIIGNRGYVLPLGANSKPMRALSGTERSNTARLSKALTEVIPCSGRAIEGNAAQFAVEDNPLRRVEELERLAQASLDDARKGDRIEKPKNHVGYRDEFHRDRDEEY